MSVTNGGTLTISGGTFAHDPSEYLSVNTYYESYSAISKANDDGTYTVSTGKNAISGEGIYKSRIVDGTYEQMGVFKTTLNGTTEINFLVNDKPVTFKSSTFADGEALVGIIITDIPVNEKVTITLY